MNGLKSLRRDKKNGILSGLCAGLGGFFGISPWIFRGLFIAPFIVPFVSGLASAIIYVILSFLVPIKRDTQPGEIDSVEYRVLDNDEDSDDTIDCTHKDQQ